ncbi:MAG: urease accessory protein UreD [Magnetovibrio sp.]|nr:urease accessory protein UreD [Magnetovibrio sp.]
MSVVISQSEHAPHQPSLTVHGIGRVAYGVDSDGVTRLHDLYQRDPVRIMFPVPPRNEIQSAVFVNTSGGLVGGDILELTAQAAKDVAVRYYPQAAEKVYRSNGPKSQIQVSLTVEEGAWMEWLPQETILFDGAKLHRQTQANIAPGGRLLAGEMLVLGRTSMGETVQSGLLQDEWNVHADGRLVWADSFCLDEDFAQTIHHPAGLNGSTALATVIYVADDAEQFLTAARELLNSIPTDVRVGITLVGGVLITRFLAKDALTLRKAFGNYWAEFRHLSAQLPAALPRLWHI